MLRLLLPVCLLAATAVVFVNMRNRPQAPRVVPQSELESDYVGAQACRSCHPSEFKAWAESPHGKHATPRGEPEGGADLAVGSQWMQAYLRKDASGHHRILPQCLDLRTGDWRPVDDVLREIRGRPQPESRDPSMHTAKRSFERDCSGCHASGTHLRLHAGYMAGHWRDGAIDCEACHGPGRAHTEAWRRMDDSQPMARIEDLSAVGRTGVCTRCHGGPPAVGAYAPEDAEHYIARSKNLTGIYSSGAAAGQSYQAHAFRRSPCHTLGGLVCSDCHDSHGSELRSPGHVDAMCTRCHGEQADARHSHHDPAKQGARCVSCHMPHLLDGVMAHQRDHRIGLPLPHARQAPDACTACHTDRDKTWASRWYETWWGTPPTETLDAIRGVHLARSGKRQEAAPLLETALTHEDPFFRWTALSRLDRPERGIGDPSPEVRVAAMFAAERSKRIDVLRAFRSDPHPVVRGLAYGALVGLGRPDGPAPEADLRIAARQSRDLVIIRIELAATWLEAGKDAQVVPMLEQIVALGDGAPDVTLLLAAAQEALGQVDAARMTLQPFDGEPGRLTPYVRGVVRTLMNRRRVNAARKVLRVGEKRASYAVDRQQIRELTKRLQQFYGGAPR